MPWPWLWGVHGHWGNVPIGGYNMLQRRCHLEASHSKVVLNGE